MQWYEIKQTVYTRRMDMHGAIHKHATIYIFYVEAANINMARKAWRVLFHDATNKYYDVEIPEYDQFTIGKVEKPAGGYPKYDKRYVEYSLADVSG